MHAYLPVQISLEQWQVNYESHIQFGIRDNSLKDQKKLKSPNNKIFKSK